MRKLLASRTGSAALLWIGLVFVLLLLTFLLIELGGLLENYGHAESVLQRCCNTAVEKNIDDAWRADGVLVLDPAGAERDFRYYAAKDLPERYTLEIAQVRCTETPPSMTVTGSITFATVFSLYGFGERTHTFRVTATNYDLDGGAP